MIKELPKVRTINKVYDEIIKDDPDTAITKNAIRQAVLSGEIPSKSVGRTYLITLENVLRYFLESEA